MFAATSLIGLAAVIVLTCYRVDWGFMLFVGVVLIFDQFPPSGYARSIIGVEYFQNLKSLRVDVNLNSSALEEKFRPTAA